MVIGGLAAVIGLAALAGVALAGTNEDLAAINKVREMEAASLTNADVSAMEKIFAADVESVPPGEPALEGVAAVRDWFAAMIDEFDGRLEYTSSDVMIFGDWAVEHYAGKVTLTPKAGGEAVVEYPRGIHIYHRGEDGAWRITQDVWNYGPPPAE
jgi:ketosteroid isomerase-like protein